MLYDMSCITMIITHSHVLYCLQAEVDVLQNMFKYISDITVCTTIEIEKLMFIVLIRKHFGMEGLNVISKLAKFLNIALKSVAAVRTGKIRVNVLISSATCQVR